MDIHPKSFSGLSLPSKEIFTKHLSTERLKFM
jgi:hypothetical protein